MKKLLISLSLLLLPAVVFGAYNDVSMGTSVVLTINDTAGNAVNLTVTGTADVIESIIVGASSLTFGLQSGSTLSVQSTSRNLITVNAPSANSSISCDDSASSVTLTATAGVTATISVSPNACGASTTTGATGSNGPVAQSGGGGGGGGTYVAPKVATIVAGSETQQANTTPSPIGSSNITIAFFAKVFFGSRVSAVLTLQKILNSDSDTQVSLSGAGSPGNETNYFGPATKKAIQKFQIKYGIAKQGQSGYGVFGPKTKAKIKEVGKLKGILK